MTLCGFTGSYNDSGKVLSGFWTPLYFEGNNYDFLESTNYHIYISFMYKN